MHSCRDIDCASRGVKYDLKRKMNYFSIAISENSNSLDLFTTVQRYIHMIELYHLNLKVNLADVCEGEESDEDERMNYTIQHLLDLRFGDNRIDPILKLLKLKCKIVGLRSIKGIDGIDFMLNKAGAKCYYLESGDSLEAMWSDIDPAASKSSIINGQNRCEVIKTIGKGGFSLVYLIRNYNMGLDKSKSLMPKESSTRIVDPESSTLYKIPKRDVTAGKSNTVSGEGPSVINIYALKSMDKSLITQWKKMDYVMNEKEILTMLDHPFIMKMHYSFSTKNYLNLVLDFCPGGELFFHIVKNKRFEESVARFYIAEIILAIGHLHKNDVLYRDLKPENVLIDYDGHIKLTDFGLSAMNFTKDSTSDIFCGSPEYMPPEMILKQKYGRMIDYYAVGALLYEMIAGIPPFYSKKRKKLFNNIVHKEVKFYKEFSSASKDLIRHLLHKDPTKRLGRNGIDEIKKHKFFKKINWDELLAKEVEPPYKPSMREVNFSNEFTSIPVTFNFEEEITRTERILSDPFMTPINDGTTRGLDGLAGFGDLAKRACKDMGFDDKDNPFLSSIRKSSEYIDRSDYNLKIISMASEDLKLDSAQNSVSDDGHFITLNKSISLKEYKPPEKSLFSKQAEKSKGLKVDANRNNLFMKIVSVDAPEPELVESPSPAVVLHQDSASIEKEKRHPTRLVRKLSDSEMMKDSDDRRLIMKQMHTFVSSRQLNLIDIFSSNVISERVRQDPHENKSEKEFETIPEQESADSDVSYGKLDEDVNINHGISAYSSAKIISKMYHDEKSSSSHKDDSVSKSCSFVDKSGASHVESSTRKTSKIEAKHMKKKDKRRPKVIEEIVIVEFNEIDADQIFEDSVEEYLPKEKALSVRNPIRASIIHHKSPYIFDSSNVSSSKQLTTSPRSDSHTSPLVNKTRKLEELKTIKEESFNPFEVDSCDQNIESATFERVPSSAKSRNKTGNQKCSTVVLTPGNYNSNEICTSEEKSEYETIRVRESPQRSPKMYNRFHTQKDNLLKFTKNDLHYTNNPYFHSNTKPLMNQTQDVDLAYSGHPLKSQGPGLLKNKPKNTLSSHNLKNFANHTRHTAKTAKKTVGNSRTGPSENLKILLKKGTYDNTKLCSAQFNYATPRKSNTGLHRSTKTEHISDGLTVNPPHSLLKSKAPMVFLDDEPYSAGKGQLFTKNGKRL